MQVTKLNVTLYREKKGEEGSCALYAAFGGGEQLAPRHPLRALADGGRVAAAHEQGVRRWGGGCWAFAVGRC